VLAATDQPVALEVREVPDDRVPEGMTCLGTFLDGTLVARCAVPPGALEFFAEQGLFAEPRQLVLSAREAEPGLRCELYALVPLPEGGMPSAEEEPEEPWAVSVPSFEDAMAAADAEDDDEDDDTDEVTDDEGQPMAAILLGQIVRFQRDRKHPESLPLETVDILARIVSGRVVEVVDKVLEDLLGP
jgi:hypothetical protein